jgi:hypothetical protein
VWRRYRLGRLSAKELAQMARGALRSLMIGACSLPFAVACATIPPAGPTHFYASYSGDDPLTKPVFDVVDARLRAEPGFIRDFSEPMQVHIADGAPSTEGQFRYRVRITIPARLADRRISERNRNLADFSVTCAPDRPQPCVDDILVRARLQPAKIRRIVARSPRA